MTDSLSSNFNHSFSNNNSQTENGNKYSNLNLNQNHKNQTLIPVHSCSKLSSDKYGDGKIDCCSPFKNSKLLDSTVSDAYEGKGKLQTWNKSSKISSLSIFKPKQSWKKDSSRNNNNKSTLSLHISAYENSNESDSNVESLKEVKSEANKKHGNTKQIFTDVSTFNVQNPFEFPRQQNNNVFEPEVAQLRASQRLQKPEVDNYEPLGPVPAGELPPPPPPPPAGAAGAAANLDPISHAPPQTKFENALGNNNTSKTDLRSAKSSAPPSKKGGGSKAKKGSKQNSLKTEENVQEDEEEEEEAEPSKRNKKMGYGKRANISLTIVITAMVFSGIGMILGIVGMVNGWTLPDSDSKLA